MTVTSNCSRSLLFAAAFALAGTGFVACGDDDDDNTDTSGDTGSNTGTNNGDDDDDDNGTTTTTGDDDDTTNTTGTTPDDDDDTTNPNGCVPTQSGSDCGPLEVCLESCATGDTTCQDQCQQNFSDQVCTACIQGFQQCAQANGCVTGNQINVLACAEFCAEDYNACFQCDKLPLAGACTATEVCIGLQGGGAICQPADFGGFPNGPFPGADGKRGGKCTFGETTGTPITCEEGTLCVGSTGSEFGLCVSLCPVADAVPPITEEDCKTGETCTPIGTGDSAGGACFPDAFDAENFTGYTGADGARGGKCTFSATATNAIRCAEENTTCVGQSTREFGICIGLCPAEDAVVTFPTAACEGTETCAAVGIGGIKNEGVCYAPGFDLAGFDFTTFPGADGKRNGKCSFNSTAANPITCSDTGTSCIGQQGKDFGICLAFCPDDDAVPVGFPAPVTCGSGSTCEATPQRQIPDLCLPDGVDLTKDTTFPGPAKGLNGRCTPTDAEPCTDATTSCIVSGTGATFGICVQTCVAETGDTGGDTGGDTTDTGTDTTDTGTGTDTDTTGT
jgi:hypothetical protein